MWLSRHLESQKKIGGPCYKPPSPSRDLSNGHPMARMAAVVNALSDGIPLDLVQKDAEIIHASNYNNFSNRNHSSSSFTGNETVSSMRSIQNRPSENHEGYSSSINPFRKASQPNSSVAQSDHEIEYNSAANSTTLNPFRKVPRPENSDGSNAANGHL